MLRLATIYEYLADPDDAERGFIESGFGCLSTLISCSSASATPGGTAHMGTISAIYKNQSRRSEDDQLSVSTGNKRDSICAFHGNAVSDCICGDVVNDRSPNCPNIQVAFAIRLDAI